MLPFGCCIQGIAATCIASPTLWLFTIHIYADWHKSILPTEREYRKWEQLLDNWHDSSGHYCWVVTKRQWGVLSCLFRARLGGACLCLSDMSSKARERERSLWREWIHSMKGVDSLSVLRKCIRYKVCVSQLWLTDTWVRTLNKERRVLVCLLGGLC